MHYDVASKSYSVTFAGAPAGSETFAATTQDSSSKPGSAVYKKTDGSVGETLTLTSRSPSSGVAFDYVAAGSWWRNQQNGSGEDAFYQPFVYGFPTEASSVPRSGSAGYDIDVDGFIAFHNTAPRTATGSGKFNADFLSGLYSLNASVVEMSQATGSVLTTAPLHAAGHLGADGSFSGRISYDNPDSAWVGTLNGSLYGPEGKEIGATFLVSGGDGDFAGSVIGAKNSSGVVANLALTNLLVPQQFTSRDVVLGEDILSVGAPAMEHITYFAIGPDGGGSYQTVSGLTAGFTTADQVSAPGSPFNVYRKTTVAGDEEFDLFKPGTANDEVALTYAGFGEWRLASPSDPSNPRQEFFTYGVVTPFWTMAAKTGTAQYTGVVHGGGAVQSTSIRYNLFGTAAYSVNFSSNSYTGSLAIKGVDASGGVRDFGLFDVHGIPLGANGGNSYPLGDFADTTQNGAFVGQISNRFFGPDGEEMAGVFNLTVGGNSGPPKINLTGVAVAKRN